jgi:serine/threonine protein kinase
MGTVWRAHDEVLDRDVAVKEVLLPPGLEEAEQNILYQRTYREARASARLNHPGVVTVHDVVQEDGRPWIIMELVRARPLQEIIDQDGPLPPARVAEIGVQLLEALNHAHAAGIMHRDVKPSNVMIAANGRAVLTDFGIAQMPGEVTLTQTGLVMGSPAYIAPERAQGENAIPASDLWALGATLYTAVEGRSPYERGDAMAALAAALTEDPPPPRRAGPLGPVLHGLLVRDPARRMPAGAALPLLTDVAFHNAFYDHAVRPPAAGIVHPDGPSISPPLGYGVPPYGPGAEVGETHLDDVALGRRPAGFDSGSADTVNDPPAPDASTMLENSQFGPGRYTQYAGSPRAYEQTWGAAAQSGAATQNPYRVNEETPRPKPPAGRGGAGRLKSRRFFFGGVVFAVGVALIVAVLLLWPLLTSQNSNTGGAGNRAPQSQSPAAAPPGYQRVSGTGFSLAVPTGWTRRPDSNTVWDAPDRNSFVQVDPRQWTVSSNEQAFLAEADVKENPAVFADYNRSRISEVTYRGRPATDWEFTYTHAQTRRKIHTQGRFVRFGNRTFAIYFRAPEGQWPSAANRLAVLYRTFQATP